MKKPKIQTPEWVLKGFDSEKEYLKKTGKKKESSGKKFKIKKCPKCKSREIKVILTGKEDIEDEESEDSLKTSKGAGKGEWECKKCKWKGNNIIEEEVGEEEFLKYLEEEDGN